MFQLFALSDAAVLLHFDCANGCAKVRLSHHAFEVDSVVVDDLNGGLWRQVSSMLLKTNVQRPEHAKLQRSLQGRRCGGEYRDPQLTRKVLHNLHNRALWVIVAVFPQQHTQKVVLEEIIVPSCLACQPLNHRF